MPRPIPLFRETTLTLVVISHQVANSPLELACKVRGCFVGRVRLSTLGNTGDRRACVNNGASSPRHLIIIPLDAQAIPTASSTLWLATLVEYHTSRCPTSSPSCYFQFHPIKETRRNAAPLSRSEHHEWMRVCLSLATPPSAFCHFQQTTTTNEFASIAQHSR